MDAAATWMYCAITSDFKVLSVQVTTGSIIVVRYSTYPEGGGEAVQGMHGPAEPHFCG